jgi:hypothetical protein
VAELSCAGFPAAETDVGTDTTAPGLDEEIGLDGGTPTAGFDSAVGIGADDGAQAARDSATAM